MIKINLLLLVLLISQQALSRQIQSNHQEEPHGYCFDEGINNMDCNWYKDCLESEFNCGKKGYPLGYGLRYCTLFSERLDRFSPAAQEWIQGTLKCLKQSLKEDLIKKQEGDKKMTCRKLRADAFNSHPICYTDNGFCQLFTQQDFKEITSTLWQLANLFSITDFMSFRAIKQVIDTVIICSKQIL